MTEPIPALPADAAWVPVVDLRIWSHNPRINDGKPVERVAESLRRFGFVAPIVVWRSAGRMVAGHTRLKALHHILATDPTFVPRGAPGPGLARVIYHEFRDENEADAYALADNRLGELATWDEPALSEILARIDEGDRYAAGFDPPVTLPDEGGETAAAPDAAADAAAAETAKATLAERFGVPPFSVLDARQGYWRDRKAAWLALGIRSELGRGENLASMGGAIERRDAIGRGDA